MNMRVLSGIFALIAGFLFFTLPANSAELSGEVGVGTYGEDFGEELRLNLDVDAGPLSFYGDYSQSRTDWSDGLDGSGVEDYEIGSRFNVGDGYLTVYHVHEERFVQNDALFYGAGLDGRLDDLNYDLGLAMADSESDGKRAHLDLELPIERFSLVGNTTYQFDKDGLDDYLEIRTGVDYRLTDSITLEGRYIDHQGIQSTDTWYGGAAIALD